jgi:thiopurine S-methyltransferase
MSGPPFAVSKAEVLELFASAFDVTSLAAAEVLAEHPRFRARGLDGLTEQVYRLRRR